MDYLLWLFTDEFRSMKAKLSIFKTFLSPFSPMSISHESWVMTETEQLQEQASEMRNFL